MMSLIDCSAMQSNEVMVDAGGKGDRWDAWSYLMRGGDIHRPILSSSNGIFRSKDDAVDWMNRVAAACKSVPDEKIFDNDSYVEVLKPLAEEFIALTEERKENGELD